MADWTRFRVILQGLDPASGRFTDPALLTGDGIIPMPPRTRHVCFARDRYDGSLYLFAGGDHGRLVQVRIYNGDNGLISARELQQVVIGGATSACSSDDNTGMLYVTEPAMGVWRLDTDPEEVPVRGPVALNAPYGDLGEPLGVAGILDGGSRVTLVADTGLESFVGVSEDGDLAARRDFAEAFAGGSVNGSITGIAMGRLPVNGRMRDVMVVGGSGDAGDGFIDILPLPFGTAVNAARPASPDAVVKPIALSAPVTGGMDAADDPAIWIHPRDPARSLVLGADKGAGLGIYDLRGRLKQFLPDGRINNVDQRPGFPGHPALAHLAAGSDRTNVAVAIYAIDEATGRVSRVDARTIPAEFNDIYGMCMYRSRRTGDLYVFGTSDDGQFHQWRLFPAGRDKVDAELVRHVRIGTMTEACAADDATGHLYVAEERVGVWRYGAEPGDGDARTEVARIRPGGELTADLEGVAIYETGEDTGYLIVTSQGSDNYSVYDRQPPHDYLGTFRIRANPEEGMDGTSQTDGIEITNVKLPGYPRGLMVAQDGRYDESQNFKFVSWEDIARQLDLE